MVGWRMFSMVGRNVKGVVMGYCHIKIYGTFVGITLFTATEAP